MNHQNFIFHLLGNFIKYRYNQSIIVFYEIIQWEKSILFLITLIDKKSFVKLIKHFFYPKIQITDYFTNFLHNHNTCVL